MFHVGYVYVKNVKKKETTKEMEEVPIKTEQRPKFR